MLVTPWTLVYGTGGVAFGKVSGTLNYVGTWYQCGGPCALIGGTATSSVSFSETRVGYTVGAGVEMQLFGPWTARLEYRYTDLGKFTETFPVSTVNGLGIAATPSTGASVELHPTFQTVRVGLGLGF
jgi:outer membrane immunogenic protein